MEELDGKVGLHQQHQTFTKIYKGSDVVENNKLKTAHETAWTSRAYGWRGRKNKIHFHQNYLENKIKLLEPPFCCY